MKKDRALELAIAMMLNPNLEPSLRYVIEKLANKWAEEDLNDAYAKHNEGQG